MTQPIEERGTTSTAKASDTETHPWEPFLPSKGRVLFLGSFPPPKKRWCMDFFYPNYINDHWRIEGAIFFDDKNYFVDIEHKCFRKERIVEFLKATGIGLYDTATVVRRLRDNASDNYLEVVKATEIEALLRQMPQCRAIATTGEKATQTLCDYFGLGCSPVVGGWAEIPGHNGMRLYRLPSSSRAYPLPFEKKVAAYRKFFKETGLLQTA